MKEKVGLVCVLGFLGLLAWSALVQGIPPSSQPGQRSTAKQKVRYSPKLGKTSESITLKATWSSFLGGVKLSVAEQKLLVVKVAKHQHQYKVSLFSPLLPRRPVSLGEIWKIDPASFLFLLRQFHPHPSVFLHHQNNDANGAYGAIRAVSSKYLVMSYRLHAQFELIPHRLYYTPTCFWGSLVLDRKAKRVVAFRLHVPNQSLNVDINLGRKIEIVTVPRIELVSRRFQWSQRIRWEREIPESKLQRSIQNRHYAYSQSGWVPLEEAVKLARQLQKPIHLLVLFGRLDGEAC